MTLCHAKYKIRKNHPSKLNHYRGRKLANCEESRYIAGLRRRKNEENVRVGGRAGLGRDGKWRAFEVGYNTMVMSAEKKQQVVKEYQHHEKDSGSPEVQIALLTNRIVELTEHLKTHRKDHASRRGLLKLVGRRSSLLKYLDSVDHTRYQNVIARLGLRK
jgi:small subunit ribosomal protein S15